MKKWEDYLYPNGVLKNKQSLKDLDALLLYEYNLTQTLADDLIEQPLKGNIDFNLFKELHKNLFNEIYDWAGKLREVEIRKSSDEPFFTSTKLLKKKADEIFYDLKRANYFLNDNKEKFVIHSAELLAKLNDLHPFREGNGRTTKLFLNYLAIVNGYTFNYDNVHKDVWNKMSATAHTLGDTTGLISILNSSIEPLYDLEYINKFRKSLGIPLLDKIKEPPMISQIIEGDNIMNESKKPGNPIKLPKTSKEYNDYIVNMFLEQLNQPPEEWVRGWVYASNQPKNGLSGRKYTGINSFVLSMYMASQQTSDPRFYTAGQVFGSDRKITVNKGEKAAVVISTYLFKYKDLSDGLIHLQHFEKLDEYLNKPELYEVLPPEKRVAIKYTVLYHAKQLSGIEPYKEVQREERQLDPFVAEALKAMNIPLYENIRARCPYFTESGGEKICIPPMKNFVGQEQLDSALLHELIHATGTEKRLNRDTLKNYFVSTDIRAKEELVAELGAVFALQETNVKVTKPADIKNHVSYVQSWKNHIQEKNGIEYLKEAINKAQEASNYLCGLTLERIKAKEEQNRENKSNYCMLMETLKYSEKHILDCGVEIEKADGGLCYKQNGKHLYVVFSPTTKKEDSCKLVAEEGFPNHYRIPVIARDVKDWDLIDKEIWKCLDESKYKEHENNKERER